MSSHEFTPVRFAADVRAVQSIDAVPKILEVICKTTGMGFAAVARVTDERWICCAVHDRIDFGLEPGGELHVETTLCHEIRQHHKPIIIEDVAKDPIYCDHHTPATYGLQSYISLPIFLADGSFFGTLCAIDPKPHPLMSRGIADTLQLFAELIGVHLATADRLAATEADLSDERKSAELREQFIAVLGHDLRNPLASIAAIGHRLKKASLTGEEKGFVDLIQNSVRRMAGLIDNILDFARGKLGGGLPVHQVPVDLVPVLRQVVSELQASVTNEIIFKNDPNLTVDCDPVRLAQLLSNLLGNAVTHGSKQDPVVVEATVAQGQFELSVINGGSPIPADAIDRLFKPFTRASGETQGLGLGLFIAFEIARAHHGTLEVSSTAVETRFRFRMPAHAASTLA